MGKKKKRSGPDSGFKGTTDNEVSQAAMGRFNSGAFQSRLNVAQPPSHLQLENRSWTSSSYGGQVGPSFQSGEPAKYEAPGVRLPREFFCATYPMNRVPSQASRLRPESRVTGMYDALQESIGLGYAPPSAYVDSYEDIRDRYSNQPFSSPHSRAAQTFNYRENSGHGRVLDEKIRGFELPESLAAGKEQIKKLNLDDTYQQGLRSKEMSATGRREPKSLQSNHRNSDFDSLVDRFESANKSCAVQSSSMGTEKMTARAEKAATVAYEEVLVSGKGVTLWKVIQGMLLVLKADSLESLGIQLHDVPSLQKLLLLEGKVNTYIQCHVAVRRITTLHDLSVEISQHEGVKDFNQLGLGPISSHPLVAQYFTPPAQSEVCKITTEDVLQHLSDYMNTNPGKIQIKDFLSFMTKERSLPSPEHLCVCIQSFGVYASFIRREKKAEKAVASHRANLAIGKEFSAAQQTQEPSITKRIDLFLAATRNEDAVDHAQHSYLGSNDDEPSVIRDMKSSGVGGTKNDTSAFSQLQSNSCPYPSAAEERVRLLAKFPTQESEYTISKQELGDFISAWKDICHNHSVCEVFTRILDAYPNKSLKKSVKMKMKLAKMFKVYPAIGILNVAVMSMKAGYWDSLYDAFEDAAINKIHQNKEANTAEAPDGIDITTLADGQPLPAAEASDCIDITATATSQLSPKGVDLTDPSADEGAPGEEVVLKEVVRIFGKICMEEDTCLGIIGHGASDEERLWAVVKSITKCEKILVQQFSLNEFSSLKFGKFSEFIEDHWDKISEEILGIYRKRIRRRHWENLFPDQRVWSFIFQVTVAIGDVKQISEKKLLQLFYKQFHLQGVDDWFLHLLENFVNPVICGSNPNCSMYFSSALLATKTRSLQSSEMEGLWRSENDANETQAVCQVGLLGSVTSSDARCCLLKAPMLCNLSQWSQWNSVFAPTLGPLLDWLEREGPSADLVCLVTCEGPILRIDGSASVDSFLAAAVKGCGRQAALQLVSLLAVYGGIDQIPHSLLKSRLSQAIEILVGKSQTVGRLKRKKKSIFEKDQAIKRAKQHAFEDTGSFSRLSSEPIFNGGEHQSLDKYWDAINFIFDLMSHVPSELVVFAGSIIYPSLSGIVPAASATMLDFCVTAEHRMKLHEIGVALGIPEWTKDFSSLFLASTMPRKSSAESLSRGVTVHDQSESSILAACRVNDPEEDNNLVPNEVTNKLLFETQAASVSITAHITGEGHDHVGLGADIGTSDGVEAELAQNNDEKEARDVIEKIRKEEFGMDLDLESQELGLLSKQHARMGRALQCLSRELYSQDSHFVLELVQNADDNQYAPGVEAMLVFILQSKRVVVVNNEIGFSAANVKALCDVGNSTKSGSAAGYIGHKGIGFKSVFRVTDAPEIHSKGFHIKFDVSQGNIGFILPTVIPAVTDWHSINEVLSTTEKLTGQGKQIWNTCMVLPLKPSVCEGPELEIFTSKLCDLQPSLLLFLHRLQSIAVKDDLTGSIRVMQRQELNDGLVRVLDGGNCATWLVVKQKFDAIVERRGVCTTEIALAFPLRELSNGVYEALTEHQQVFSFLPLRSYGLRFIVQADFILPASREEIDSDSAWNQWLLSEIPKVCLKAVETLKELACFQLNLGRATSLLMSFIPLEGEVQGIFSPLPRMILAILRASHCLPVEGNEGEWALPCVLLGGWTSFSRRLLPDGLLKEHLGLSYLHRDVTINSLLASSLGVHMYGLRVLIGIMKSLCNRKEALEALGPRWISTWLVALHRCFISESQQAPFLNKSQTDMEDLKILRQLSFIPLSNGIYTSIEEGPVWLPSVDVGNVNEMDAFLQDFPLLYSELRTVHSLLLNPIYMENDNSDMLSTEIESSSLKTEYRSLASLMLHRLGVGQMLAHEILTTQVMPSMLSEDFSRKEKALVLQYLAFVMVHLQSNCKQCKTDRSNIFMQLQKNAIIITNNGYRKLENQPLHFGLEFGCPVDVDSLLNGLQIEWTKIDSAYLQAFNGWPQETALSEWRQFLRDLGVSDFVKPEKVVKRVHNKSASIWKELSWEGCDDRDDLCVQDWECSELVKILRGLCDSDLDMVQKLAQCSHLLSAFDLLWEEHYSDCKATYWCERAAKKLESKTESSFILQMRSFAWIESSFDGRLYHPTKLFHRCFAVESILGNSGPYATPQIQCAKLVEALGLRTKVSVLDVLDLLRMWNQRPFKASIGQMTRLYTFLWNEMAPHREDVLVFFQTHASVFVPLKMNFEPDTPVLGSFLPVKDVCWSDETGVLALMMRSKLLPNGDPPQGTCVRALDSFYPTIHGFFLDLGLVRDTLNFRESFGVLKILAEIYAPREILGQVLAVFAKWSHDIEMNQMSPADCCELKVLLQNVDSRVLPTMQDKWVSLHSSTGLVCWCDDEMLGQQFMQSRGIFYVHVQYNSFQKLAGAVGNSKFEHLSSFLKAMDIPPLSQVVEREPIVYGAQNSRQLSDLLNWSLPYVQRYLWKWHPDGYTMLQQSSFTTRLNQFRCFLASQVFFRFVLPGGLGSGSERFECDYLLQGDCFYATQLGNFNSLFLEFSRIFFNGIPNMQLANFLHLITLSAQSGSQETEVEAQLLNSQGISPLPKKEKQWTIESRDFKMLLDSASERQLVRHSNDQDSMPKKRVRDVADNVWPPRSWHQMQSNSLYRAQVDRIEACEKSLASVMKDIEAKKKAQFQAGERHVSSETHACVSGGPHGVGRSLSLFDKDQRFEEATVLVPAMGTTSQDEYDNVELVNRRKGEGLATTSSRDGLLFEGSSLGLDNASDRDFETDGTHVGSFADREQLSVGQSNEQQQTLTGRLGEAVVFNYLLGKHGPACVTWINAEAESGLPYDIIVNEIDGRQKLIEVKATWSENKDWFEITNREWELALQAGEKFVIIRVFLFGPLNTARLLWLPNPIKLCQDRAIKLALILPQDHSEGLAGASKLILSSTMIK